MTRDGALARVMLKKSLHSRILILIAGFISIGVAVSVYLTLKHEEREHLEEKLRASRIMSQPILKAIYDDMLEERADLARHLVSAMGKVEGVEGVYIVRGNGVEEAFKDLKTIAEVKRVYGKVRPEWLDAHPDEEENHARGVATPEFKMAFDALTRNAALAETHFIDRSSGRPVFTYLQPIENRAECARCHGPEGARGMLVIRTSLDEMYAYLDERRNQSIAVGLLAIFVASVLLSVLIRKSITGPIRRNVDIIRRIAEGGAGVSERLEVGTENEIGYLASAFNSMLDSLEKRNEENTKLFDMVSKSRQEWVATFDAIQDLISIHDGNCNVLKVNKALARKFNAEPEDLLGKKCHEIFLASPDPTRFCDTCPHSRTLLTGEVGSSETDEMAFEGTYKITTFPVFNEFGEVWASVHVARDITQEKLLREQLLHSEKLSTVGKLVAGIAHELNNPLMGIMGFSQILIDMPGDKKVEDIREKLRKIYHESLRTAKIVQNLLTFARAKKSEREYHNINEILRHTLELREYSLKTSRIQVVFDLDETLPHTMVDLFQMQQVFINIMTNAEDAMAAKGGGRLEISTRRARRKILIRFRDTGPGVPKEIIHKVFDPFFTTKDVGKGTGLGLSITHGIITEHGGTIEITSPEDGGALVSIELPVVEKEQWVEVKKAVDGVVGSDVLAGKGVLIVDDEKSIRASLYDILAREGFRVDTARDGLEAVEILERKRFALVITDVKMPGLDGMGLYEAIQERHGYLKDKVIMLTGDVFSQEIKDFLSRCGCPSILKPFEPRELTRLIRQVMARP
jgi:PAS domain S-box-containing protein